MDTFPPCSKKRDKKSHFYPPIKKFVSLQDVFIIGAYDKATRLYFLAIRRMAYDITLLKEERL